MAEYFSHDYNARNDPKLAALHMEMGYEGIGIFWCLVEIMYEQGGYINISDLKSVAFTMQVQLEKLEKLVDNFQLFCVKNDKIFSRVILNRIKQRKIKCNKAKQAIKKRWDNQRELNNTDVLPTYYERNTIKERKGKERIKDVNDTTLRRAHATDIIEPRKEALPAPCPSETDSSSSSSQEGTATSTAQVMSVRGYELLTKDQILRISKLPPDQQIAATEGMLQTKRKQQPPIIRGVI